MRSLDLRKEPSVRQSETIMRRIEAELTARGARVERAGAVGGLRFRMPRPWDAPRLGILLAITSGRAVVSAGSGGPWRVRYELDFSALRWLTIGLTVMLVFAGATWNRIALLNAIVALWVVAYGIPYVAASLRFAAIIRRSAAEILERRRHTRDATSGDIPGGPNVLPPPVDQPADDPPEVREQPPITDDREDPHGS
jgi:hypothetical protein